MDSTGARGAGHGRNGGSREESVPGGDNGSAGGNVTGGAHVDRSSGSVRDSAAAGTTASASTSTTTRTATHFCHQCGAMRPVLRAGGVTGRDSADGGGDADSAATEVTCATCASPFVEEIESDAQFGAARAATSRRRGAARAGAAGDDANAGGDAGAPHSLLFSSILNAAMAHGAGGGADGSNSGSAQTNTGDAAHFATAGVPLVFNFAFGANSASGRGSGGIVGGAPRRHDATGGESYNDSSDDHNAERDDDNDDGDDSGDDSGDDWYSYRSAGVGPSFSSSSGDGARGNTSHAPNANAQVDDALPEYVANACRSAMSNIVQSMTGRYGARTTAPEATAGNASQPSTSFSSSSSSPPPQRRRMDGQWSHRWHADNDRGAGAATASRRQNFAHPRDSDRAYGEGDWRGNGGNGETAGAGGADSGSDAAGRDRNAATGGNANVGGNSRTAHGPASRASDDARSGAQDESGATRHGGIDVGADIAARIAAQAANMAQTMTEAPGATAREPPAGTDAYSQRGAANRGRAAQSSPSSAAAAAAAATGTSDGDMHSVDRESCDGGVDDTRRAGPHHHGSDPRVSFEWHVFDTNGHHAHGTSGDGRHGARGTSAMNDGGSDDGNDQEASAHFDARGVDTQNAHHAQQHATWHAAAAAHQVARAFADPNATADGGDGDYGSALRDSDDGASNDDAEDADQAASTNDPTGAASAATSNPYVSVEWRVLDDSGRVMHSGGGAGTDAAGNVGDPEADADDDETDDSASGQQSPQPHEQQQQRRHRRRHSVSSAVTGGDAAHATTVPPRPHPPPFVWPGAADENMAQNIGRIIQQMLGMQHGAPGDYGLGMSMQDIMEHIAQNDPNRYGAPPAAKGAVESLRRYDMTDAVREEGERAGGSTTECAICRDEFDVGHRVMEMPCRHVFCEGCLLEWLRVHSSCPTCRAEIRSNDDEYEAEKARRARADGDRRSEASGSGSGGGGVDGGESHHVDGTVTGSDAAAADDDAATRGGERGTPARDSIWRRRLNALAAMASDAANLPPRPRAGQRGGGAGSGGGSGGGAGTDGAVDDDNDDDGDGNRHEAPSYFS